MKTFRAKHIVLDDQKRMVAERFEWGTENCAAVEYIIKNEYSIATPITVWQFEGKSS